MPAIPPSSLTVKRVTTCSVPAAARRPANHEPTPAATAMRTAPNSTGMSRDDHRRGADRSFESVSFSSSSSLASPMCWRRIRTSLASDRRSSRRTPLGTPSLSALQSGSFSSRAVSVSVTVFPVKAFNPVKHCTRSSRMPRCQCGGRPFDRAPVPGSCRLAYPGRHPRSSTRLAASSARRRSQEQRAPWRGQSPGASPGHRGRF